MSSRVGQNSDQSDRCSSRSDGRRGVKEETTPQANDSRVLRSESHSSQVSTVRRRKDAPRKRQERMGDKGD